MSESIKLRKKNLISSLWRSFATETGSTSKNRLKFSVVSVSFPKKDYLLSFLLKTEKRQVKHLDETIYRKSRNHKRTLLMQSWLDEGNDWNYWWQRNNSGLKEAYYRLKWAELAVQTRRYGGVGHQQGWYKQTIIALLILWV